MEEVDTKKSDFSVFRLPLLGILIIPLVTWIVVPNDKDFQSLIISTSLIYILPIELLILPLFPSAWNINVIARQLESRQPETLLPLSMILILVPAVLISIVLGRLGRKPLQAGLLGFVWSVASIEALGASMVFLLYLVFGNIGPR